MRTLKRVLLTGSAAALAFGAWSGTAQAQLDIDPPLPNVLLLVDTSGTMEYLIKPDASGANVLPGAVPGSECDPSKPAATTLNRWASLVSVLTGTINGFSCQATPRNTPEFKAEYGLGVTPLPGANWLAPYDWSYYLPFNRMYSNGCTPGPGVKSSNWYDWPVGSIHYHDPFGDSCAQPWSQRADGLLDTFRDRVRFGMMTFDTLPDENTGVTSSGTDYPGGMKGMWSYYPSWNPASGNYAQGYPPNCASTPFEVGARGPGAPPWEGRLIPFGAWDASLVNVHDTNDHIQEALISMRPYGATPISGLFDDARTFLTKDTDIDQNTTKPFGPKDDPYAVGGCRKQYIIFLTDGANGPDFDLRPSCNQVGGVCPYQPATTTAQALASQPGNTAIQTFVVGFAVSNPAALSSLVPADELLAARSNEPGCLRQPACGADPLLQPLQAGDRRRLAARVFRRRSGRSSAGALRHPREHHLELDGAHHPGVRAGRLHVRAGQRRAGRGVSLHRAVLGRRDGAPLARPAQARALHLRREQRGEPAGAGVQQRRRLQRERRLRRSAAPAPVLELHRAQDRHQDRFGQH